jgi:ribonuclease HI
MFFYGSSTKYGSGVGIVLISHSKESTYLSYKLEFETTNNIAKYESLMLGLRAAKNMNIKELVVLGDSELVILQIRNVYQKKQQRLKKYRIEVWDLTENFFVTFNISFIPTIANQREDSLALAASNCIPPIDPHLNYEVEMRPRPSTPDNVKHWKFFIDDQELKRFLETIDEFSSIIIDQGNENDKAKNQTDILSLNEV